MNLHLNQKESVLGLKINTKDRKKPDLPLINWLKDESQLFNYKIKSNISFLESSK